MLVFSVAEMRSWCDHDAVLFVPRESECDVKTLRLGVRQTWLCTQHSTWCVAADGRTCWRKVGIRDLLFCLLAISGKFCSWLILGPSSVKWR